MVKLRFLIVCKCQAYHKKFKPLKSIFVSQAIYRRIYQLTFNSKNDLGYEDLVIRFWIIHGTPYVFLKYFWFLTVSRIEIEIAMSIGSNRYSKFTHNNELAIHPLNKYESQRTRIGANTTPSRRDSTSKTRVTPINCTHFLTIPPKHAILSLL